jgi:2-keto-4-pentenoate hydratase
VSSVLGLSARDPLSEIARALRDAERTRTPIAPPSVSCPGLTLDAAYAIQTINIDQRIHNGERIVGHKIGLTSPAMQRQLGVDQPDFGVVTDRLVIPSGGELSSAELISPRLEAEFAFVIGADLPVNPSEEQLREAISSVALSIEVIDSRVADWKVSLVDTVADNASCARIVVGPPQPADAGLLVEIVKTALVLRAGEEEVSVGLGEAVLGDPVRALSWLAAAIGRYGQAFRADDVILAGAVAAAVPLTLATTFTVFGEGFEPVVLNTGGVRSKAS